MSIQKLSDRMNLKKKYPDYFNLWVFRSSMMLMIFFTFFIIFHYSLYDNVDRFYMQCPDTANVGCENPFYACENNPLPPNPEFCEMIKKSGCYGDYCGNAWIPAGASVGRVPSVFVTFYPQIIFGLCLFTFLINHLLYKIKTRRDLL